MTVRPASTTVLLLLAALLIAPATLTAQAIDVIRGRVTNVEGAPVASVIVTATALGETAIRMTRTDEQGRFMIVVLDGGGAYLMNYMFLGYRPQRREVRRVGHQQVITADAELEPAPILLGGVTISAVPAGAVDDTLAEQDVSGTRRVVEQTELAAAQGGELATMAASLPGVLPVAGEEGDPSGFSVLGLGPEQNVTTVNGMRFGGTQIPRDAQVTVSLVTTPYDVSRGGFSGAQLNVRTRSGTNRSTRTASAVLDAPPLQWTDAAARALGKEYTSVSVSGGLAGPIRRDRSFYNVSYQLGRRAHDLQHLFNTSAEGLRSAGISADSIGRMLDVLANAGAPAGVGRLPASRFTDHASLLGTFEAAPSTRTGSAVNLTITGGWKRQDPVTSLAAELPSHSGQRGDWNGGVQLRHTGTHRRGIVSETAVATSGSRTSATPYLRLPAGRVRVTSTFADGTSAVRTLAFGGNQALNASTAVHDAGVFNSVSWYSDDAKHRVKLTSELQYERHTVTQAPNSHGTFTFNSLRDLERAQPATFTRQLSSRVREIPQLTAGVSLGDSYVPHKDLQVQYGFRIDGNRYLTDPPFNADLARWLGIRNDVAPASVFFSPRAGFSWTYGRSAGDGKARKPRPVVRGGVGVFQNASATASIGTAIDNTGLPSGIQQVECVGPAAPVPDWHGYATAGAIPTHCADGTAGTVFSSGVPNVTLFAPDYTPPRSIRSNLSWSGPVLDDRFMLSADVTYSRNERQAGSVDVNFADSVRFTLAAEADRPVFVRPTSIVGGTGAVAWRDARLAPALARVTQMRSDLASAAKQLGVEVTPRAAGKRLSWRASYVLADVRERAHGFASTSGNPYVPEWARGTYHTRHQVGYSFGYPVADFGRLTWSGAFRSGRPFTPTISSDVNGDGYANDRAFIFDPAQAGDTALALAMHELLTNGPRGARECLVRQLGSLAARNSCSGPWTSSATMSLAINSGKLRLPKRANTTLQVTNPLGAADLLLHGNAGLRGWGQPATPERTLLYVRGFDAARQAFLYEVNPRFGATRAGFGTPRAPVTLTVVVRVNLGKQ